MALNICVIDAKASNCSTIHLADGAWIRFGSNILIVSKLSPSQWFYFNDVALEQIHIILVVSTGFVTFVSPCRPRSTTPRFCLSVYEKSHLLLCGSSLLFLELETARRTCLLTEQSSIMARVWVYRFQSDLQSLSQLRSVLVLPDPEGDWAYTLT